MEVLQSKVEVIEKKESLFTEATFKNSLKNDSSKKKESGKKKDSKKSKNDDDDKDDEDFLNLTDEEKDARDYQLQRAMDMVRAMSKIGKKNIEQEKSDKKETKKDDKKSDSKKDDKKKETKK